MMKSPLNLDDVGVVISNAKQQAILYRQLTGKPLGITGEVAEYEAARLLGLNLMPARFPGYDAIGPDNKRYQVKGRIAAKGANARVGSIKLTHKWDVVLLVLLDESFEPTIIYEAERDRIEEVLSAPGSKARQERGQLGVSKFKSIGHVVWCK